MTSMATDNQWKACTQKHRELTQGIHTHRTNDECIPDHVLVPVSLKHRLTGCDVGRETQTDEDEYGHTERKANAVMRVRV